MLVFILRVRCVFDPLRVSMGKEGGESGMSRGKGTTLHSWLGCDSTELSSKFKINNNQTY